MVNPYGSPHPDERAEAKPAAFRSSAVENAFRIGMCVAFLWVIWFGASTSIGRGFYRLDLGFFSYYYYESEQFGAVVRSQVFWRRLLLSVFTSASLIALAYHPVKDVVRYFRRKR